MKVLFQVVEVLFFTLQRDWTTLREKTSIRMLESRSLDKLARSLARPFARTQALRDQL
jgi:hypothetical protein